MIFLKAPVSGRSEINGGKQKCLLDSAQEYQLTITVNNYYSKFQSNLGAQKKNIQCVSDPEDNNLKTILPSLKIPCSLSIVSNAIETLDCSLVFYL